MGPQTIQQVQWTLEPYYAKGATESKSVVLRSNPEAYFKPYATYLTQASGKFNPALSHPTDPNVRLPGWIFPGRSEPQVRQLVQQIVAGQIAPMAAPTPPPTQSTMLQAGQPNQFLPHQCLDFNPLNLISKLVPHSIVLFLECQQCFQFRLLEV